jgi:hypothetical protein
MGNEPFASRFNVLIDRAGEVRAQLADAIEELERVNDQRQAALVLSPWRPG